MTTLAYSVKINGCYEGFFFGKRGGRQGDPLSPYIVVLCMEILTQLLNQAIVNGIIIYHPLCTKVSLAHLCFVDDLLIFSEALALSLQGIKKVMDELYSMSGLKVSYSKSEVCCSGVSNPLMQQLT